MSANVIWQRILSFFPELVKGLSGAAPAIDWTGGSAQSITLNAATVTPTFVNPPGGCSLALVATQDGVGGRAVTWPGSVTWIGGTPPVLLAGAGQTTLVNFYFDGTTYFGWLATAGSPSSLLPWTDVAAGTTLAASLSKPNLAFDTSAAQSNVTLPTAAQMANADGFEFLIKCTGNMLSPVIANAGAGTTVELLNAPGIFGASTWLPIQGQSAVFKYDLTTTTWKARAVFAGSGAPGTPAYNPGWYATLGNASWDPQAGVDSASGAPGSPIMTMAEVMRRCGSSDVTMPFGASTKITLAASGQTLNVDQVSMVWRCSGGGGALLIGVLTPNGAPFSPVTVTAKNRATPQLLVLNTIPGAIVAKNIVQNTTSVLNGWACVDAVAGGNATMSQPVANSSVTTATVVPTLTEDNAWANTDTYQAYTAPLCNLKAWRVIGGDVTAGAKPCTSWVQFITIADTSGNGGAEYPHIGDSATAVLSACVVLPRLQIAAQHGRGQGTYVISCDVTGFVNMANNAPIFFGGIARSTLQFQADGATVDGDTIVHGFISLFSGELFIGSCFCDNAAFGLTLNSASSVHLGTSFWGTGPITLNPGAVVWNASGGTFVSCIQTSGALKFGSSTVGTAPSVANTFVLNGVTQVDVAPAGGDHFPVNAVIDWSLNTVGGTPGVGSPYFSAAQAADAFHIKSPTAGANDTYNWRAARGTDTVTAANLDKYKGMYNEATGARFCFTQ